MRIQTIPAISIAIFLTLILTISGAFAQRQTEYLDRGLVAVRCDSQKIYLGWRLLSTDPENIAFNIYRSTTGKPPYN